MTKYTKDIADSICEEISQGKSLVKACKDLNVEYRHVFKWIAEEEGFKDNYTRAREAQADYLADQVMDVADDSTIASDDKRIRVDARKWYAGKLKPKKYGDKQVIAGDPDAPLNHNVTGKIDMGADLIAAAIERIKDK